MIAHTKTPDPQSAKIGFVEDDDVIRDNYTEMLQEEGYQVLTADRSDAARGLFSEEQFDLVILDVSLGNEFDAGYRLCAELRQQQKDLPIIFLTSHDSEVDHISGLRVGADDYLSKGASFAFLLVRIQTLLRRAQEFASKSTKEGAESRLRIDSDALCMYWDDDRVELPLTQYWIVRELVESAEVCNANRLMKAAQITVEPNTITAHIKSIRRGFVAIDPDFTCIRTERGKGYRWLE